MPGQLAQSALSATRGALPHVSSVVHNLSDLLVDGGQQVR